MTLAYGFVIRSILDLPFHIIGMLLGQLIGKFKIVDKANFAKITQRLATIEIVTSIVFLCAFLVSIGAFQVWLSWFEFWRSPMTLALFSYAATFGSSSRQGRVPLLRRAALGWLVAATFVVLAVCVSVLFPAYFDYATARWASICAASLLIVASLWGLWKTPKQVYSFISLDRRHDELGTQLSRLQHIANVLPDSVTSTVIQDIVRSVDTSYKTAQRALQGNKMTEAEEAIFRAEVEVEGVNRAIADRARLSLKDELKAKLNQSRIDCDELRKEFEAAGLQGADVDSLVARLAELLRKIDEITFDAESMTVNIEPFEKFFTDIISTRTALRFRRNVGTSLDNLRDELRDTESQLLIAKALNLDVRVADSARSELAVLIEEFRERSVSSAEDLVGKYRALREAASRHRAAVKGLDVEAARQYVIENVDNFDATVFVPRSVTAANAVAGAVVLRRGPHQIKALDCELDGVLIEFEQARSFVIALKEANSVSISSFHILGKRGGRGHLKVIIGRTREERTALTFNILIPASAFETGRDAVVFVTPCGSVFGLLFWYLWNNVATAGPLGTGIGGVIGLLLFLLQRIRLRSSRAT